MIAEMFYVLRPIRLTTLPIQPGNPEQAVGTTWSIGTALFTDYLLPFEVTSSFDPDGAGRSDGVGKYARETNVRGGN